MSAAWSACMKPPHSLQLCLCQPAGLLLNNLSVYRGCEIVFNSSEIPAQAVAAAVDEEDVQVSVTTTARCKWALIVTSTPTRIGQ